MELSTIFYGIVIMVIVIFVLYMLNKQREHFTLIPKGLLAVDKIQELYNMQHGASNSNYAFDNGPQMEIHEL